MGFRATGNDMVMRAFTPAHRKAIRQAGESVEDGSIRYWAPSYKARDVAELYKVAYRAEDNSLCLILTKYGRFIAEQFAMRRPQQPASDEGRG